LLAAMSPESSRRTQADLEQLGVIVQLNTRVIAHDGQLVTLNNGQQIRAQTLVWSAGVIGAVVAGLPAEAVERHRYLVNDFNQVLGVPDVFAIGDVALMKTKDWPRGHPQLAQPAIQQGRHLARNLVRKLRNEP